MGIYERIGVRRVINANTSLTRLGGARMEPEVLDAMREAAGANVDMTELQEAVSKRLAALTQNEDAFVCSGAAAGLALSVLACMTGPDLVEVSRLSEHGAGALARNQVIIHRAHRFPYDSAVRLAGAELVEVGNVLQTFDWELQAALGKRAAAVLYVVGAFLPAGALPLDEVLDIAHHAGVPVIVDAAAQQLPKENLWRLSQMGADLVVFSGGKGLRGPQCTGLIVGRASLVRACALHAAPNQRIARAMKVGKEEIIGLLVAVERFLAQDVASFITWNSEVIRGWGLTLESIAGVEVRRDQLNAGGQPIPRLRVELDPIIALDGPGLRDRLLDGNPPIDVEVAGPLGVFLSAECLEPGEELLVEARVAEILTGVARRPGKP